MPFEGFTQSTMDFMWNIRFNNNKPWFEEHKAEYKSDLLAPMKELGREVFEQINESFGSRGFIHKVSRIYKDARRRHSDGPYRDHLWFSIERPSEEWTSTPVFWFELSPEEWSYGLGYYSARPETMAKLRARIDKNPKAFEKLIAPLAKQEEFVLEGSEYVRKKAAPSPKTEAWYNKKTFSLIHNGQIEAELFTPEFSRRIAEGFAFLMPFYDYFIMLNAEDDVNA
ncbi:MAG: DUF2461 domain-containing protein [Oscillospiraceae bacterium]|jgi:uncharacterized protein (TIGR02453 family)|nr:DUF2461 domain-containing protein [Oscillospiraceae bacterium]